jgi:hypothetical protein
MAANDLEGSYVLIAGTAPANGRTTVMLFAER